jgi:hypothetical protein
MNCATFRDDLAKNNLTPESLAHMRTCMNCLQDAVAADSDNLFRSLGGDDLVPPGGTEAFVEEVLQQVHLRQTEGTLRRGRFTSQYRWAVAAALSLTITGITMSRHDQAVSPATTPVVASSRVVPANLPSVESYEEASATIVELPITDAENVKIVMIFDETLPADL